MKVYEVENLTKIYPQGKVVANDDLSFSINRGEIFGLLGPNGAGKTTLVKQLLGLLPPTSGNIWLFGADIVSQSDIVPYYVSSMAQRPSALADLKVHEALEITGRLRMLDRDQARAESDSLIEEFGLGDLRSRVIGKLSQGQQRLVSLALALVANLPVMVLDEPTNDLDPRHRKQLWDKLQDLNRTRGTTIILVTHNVIEAERVLERVGIINHGQIMAMGEVSHLKNRLNSRLRVEIAFREGSAVDGLLDQLSEHLSGEILSVSDRRYALLVDRDAGLSDVREVLSRVDLEALEDLRLLAPTLEDVYLQLGGGEKLNVTSVAN